MSSKPTGQTPREIDDIEDRMGAVHPLDFSEGADEEHGRAGPATDATAEQARQVREAGQSGGETLGEGVHEDGVSLDDLSPETLFDETGARGPDESGEAGAVDQQLSEVDGRDIGAGTGLDEAEEARVRPLNSMFSDGTR